MPKVNARPATAEDKENIVKLLEGFYPGIPNHWRKLFAPRSWKIEGDFPGFLLEDEEKVVGFLGTIFYEYESPTGIQKICNLTTWYVDPNYRRYAMALFAGVMKIPNISWTNLSPAPHILNFLIRIGFSILEDTQTFFFPIPKLLHRKKNVVLKINISEKELDLNLRHIYQTHQNLICKHFLIKKNNEQCYCLAVITRYKKIPRANIYFVSNPALFKDVIADIRFKLCTKLGVFYLLVEGNILEEKKMFAAKAHKMAMPRLYKSNHSKNDITLLGSELFILGI